MASELRRVALGLMALSMRLDAYAMQRGLTMDAAHPKDPDPKNWRTINGSKVHLTEGKIDGGAGGKFSGKAWTGKAKHEFTPKEKPKQEEPKAAAKSKAKKTAENIDELAACATSEVDNPSFDDYEVSRIVASIKQENFLDDKSVQGIKHAYEELQNGNISKTEFKNAVASIAYYGVNVPSSPKPAAAPQPTVQPQIAAQPKPGQLQTKGLSKTKLTKATTGISTPKGTLGLYAAPNWKGVIDPCFKKFEEKYGKQQIAKFTKNEHDAVYRYTQTWIHLRDYLCYGMTVSPSGIYTKEYLQREVDLISSGLSKMEHPNMWVKRGGSLKDWATKENFNGATFEALQRMQKEGTVFTNASFLSTNPSERVTYGDQSVVRHFFVPKKAKGGYIRDASAHNEELEFLLDKGTKTRIMKVEKDKNGNIITYEEVVLDD